MSSWLTFTILAIMLLLLGHLLRVIEEGATRRHEEIKRALAELNDSVLAMSDRLRR